MEGNFNGLGDDRGLDLAAKTVADALAQGKEQERTMLGELELLRSENRNLLTALRALAPTHPLVAALKSNKGRPSKSKGDKGSDRYGAGKSLRPETLEAVFTWVRTRNGEVFTIPEAIEALRDVATKDPVRRAVNMLRAAEVIRLVGKGTGGPNSAQRFKVLDESRYRVLAEDNRRVWEQSPRSVYEVS